MSESKIPKGYKLTEVGVIPEEWEVIPLGVIVNLINGRGFKPFEWKSLGLPIIRIQNLNGSDEYHYYIGDYAKKIEIDNGQLLFAWSGSKGTSFGPHIWCGPCGLLNYHTWKVVVDDSKADKAYFYHSLNSLTHKIEDEAHGASALVHVQKWEIEKYKVPLPPLPEQRAIAEALSDVDSLLSALDKLLEKKRAIKQGAMQELLTGRKRLPGFSGKWEKKKLGEIAEIKMGRTPPRNNEKYWGKGKTWLSIADLRTKVVTESKEEITSIAADVMQYIPKGTLLMSFKLSIGRLCFAGKDLYTNEAICSFNNLSEISDFLYYILSRTDFSLYGKQAVKGFTLNSESLGIVDVLLPPLPEQSAIAAILSDMDADIEALQKRRDKTKAIKQGMMQELLTGRIRLV